MRSTSLLGLILLLSQYAIASSDSDSACFENPDLVHTSGGLKECKRKDDVPHAVVKGTISDAKYEDMFLFVACRGGEWWGFKTKETEDPEKIKSKLVNCVPYCKPIGEGIQPISLDGEDYAVATTCEDPSFDLYLNDRQVTGNTAQCSYTDGWRQLDDTKSAPKRVNNPDVSTKNFECRKAPTPCSYEPTELFHFDNEKKLTCINGENTLKTILHKSERYHSLQCGRLDRSDIWKANVEEDFAKSGKKIAEASPTLQVTCEEYCSATGEGVKVTRNGDTIEVTCTDATLALTYDGRLMAKNRAQCSFNEGWKTESGVFFRKIEAQLQFKCEKYCVAKGEELNVRSGQITEVTCKDQTLGLVYGDSQMWEGTARCSLNELWMEGRTGSRIFAKDILTPQQFMCNKPCTLHQADSIPFDSTTQTYSCKSRESSGSSIWKIEFNNQPYDSVKCDNVNGWKAGDKTIVDAYVPLKATCTNYCSYSGEGTKFKQIEDGIEVYCADSDYGLAIKSDRKRYKSLRCTKNDVYQWTAPDNRYSDLSALDPKIHADFTCQKYHCHKSTYEGFHYNSTEKKLSCKSEGGNSIRLVEHNSKPYPYFLCDQFNGWSGIGDDYSREKYNVNPTNAKCAEYCAVTGTGVKIEVSKAGYSSEYPSLNVRCETPLDGELFFDGKGIGGHDSTCLVTKGWFIPNSGNKYVSDNDVSSTKPMHIECRAPTTTTRTTTTTTTTTAGPMEAEAPLENSEEQKIIIIVCVIGGILAVIIITVMIIAVCLLMKKRPENNDTMIKNETNRSERMNPRYNDEVKSARFDRQL